LREQPLVAVVTLNWNGAAYLKECVDSILASDYPNFVTIISDNGSTDGSLKLLETVYGGDLRVTVLENGANLGYSLGMNRGLSHGFGTLGADYCLVMNNDTRIDGKAISSLVKAADADERIAFVTGKVYYYDAPDTFQTVGKASHPVLINGGHIGRGEIDAGQYDQDRELAFCDDIFWLVSKQVYDATGGYDPEFYLQSEDFDWQLRAKNAGYKIMYAHNAKIWHKESMSLGKRSSRKAYYDARNPMVAVMKNCVPSIAAAYLKARTYKVLLPSIAKNALKGNMGISLAMFRGMSSAWIWRYRHGLKKTYPDNATL
jgi:GT2 family glycosyltransferase